MSTTGKGRQPGGPWNLRRTETFLPVFKRKEMALDTVPSTLASTNALYVGAVDTKHCQSTVHKTADVTGHQKFPRDICMRL